MSEVRSPTGGNVWKVMVAEGASVEAGAELMILESMKMEIPVEATTSGAVKLEVKEGDRVSEDQVLARVE